MNLRSIFNHERRKRNIHLKQHRMNFWVLLNYICSVKSSKEWNIKITMTFFWNSSWRRVWCIKQRTVGIGDKISWRWCTCGKICWVCHMWTVTGEALSEQIIKTVSSLLRSKSYDGAGNMAAANKGCASRIKVCFQELNIITAWIMIWTWLLKNLVKYQKCKSSC